MIVPDVYPNFASPEMIYECIKRVFAGPTHDNSSDLCKFKTVEVILKFAKLYDGIDLNDDELLKSHFDEVLRFDFMQVDQRTTNLEISTHDVLMEGYDSTPPNFAGNPSKETIMRCV